MIYFKKSIPPRLFLGFLLVGSLSVWGEENTSLPIPVVLEQAQRASDEGRFEEALTLYGQILKETPGHSAALAGIRETEKKHRAFQKKIQAQERKNLWVVEDLLSQGRWVDAQDKVMDVLTRVPDHPEALLLRNVIRAKAEQAHESNRSGNARWYESLGVLAYLDGDWGKAVDCWQRILELNPKRTELKDWLEKAISQREIQKRTDRIEALILQARSAHREGRFADAESLWKELLDLDPAQAAAREGLEKARIAREEVEADIKTKKIQAWQLSAIEAAAAGNREDSLAYWRKILELDPGNVLAGEFVRRHELRKTAFELFDKKNYEEALDKLDEVLLSEANDAEALRYRKIARGIVAKSSFAQGVEARKAGEMDRAEILLKQAIRLDPQNSEIQKQWAEVREQVAAKNREKSQDSYREALDAFLTGDMETAQKLANKSLELDEKNLEAKRLLDRLTQRNTP